MHGLELSSGVRSPVAWQELGALLDTPAGVRKVWADCGRVRVVTAAHTSTPDGDDQAAVLADARGAHRLVVLDDGCGSGALAADPGLRSVAVVPASGAGLARARLELTQRSKPPDVIAVVAIHGGRAPRQRTVRRALGDLGDAVVLVPHCAELLANPSRAGELLRFSACDVLSALGEIL